MIGPGGFSSRHWMSMLICMLILSFPSSIMVGNSLDVRSGHEDVSSPPSSGNWTISGLESYSDSVIEINDNITISGSLLLDNCTLVLGSSSLVPSILSLVSGGRITTTNGTMIQGYTIGSFLFRAMNGSVVDLKDTTVEGCGNPEGGEDSKGIYLEDSTMECINVTVMETVVGITGVGSVLNLTGMNILECQEKGIMSSNNSILDLKMANISNAMEFGIQVKGSNATLDHIDMENCGVALEIEDSNDVTVYDSELSSNNPGSVIIENSNVSIMDCNTEFPTFSGLSVSGSLERTSVYLLNSTFSEIMVIGPGIVTEAYRYDIGVTKNNGLPAKLADVEIKGPDGVLEVQALTGSDGWIRDVPLVTAFHRAFGISYNEPHNLSLLYEGANRMKDFNSSLNHFTTIRVLLSIPVISFTEPSNGTWFDTRSVHLKGFIEDERPIEFLGMLLDSASEVSLDPAKVFDIPFSFGSDGEHVLRLRAVNDDGKAGEATIYFGIDTEDPLLVVDSPEDGTFTSSLYVNVTGYCDEDSRLLIEDNTGKYLVNHTGGTFTYGVQLIEGWNDITISAEDRAGNSALETRKVYLDQTPPTLRILTPVNGTTIKNDFIQIKGSVSHDTVEVLVNGIEVDFDLMGFTYRFEDLSEGSNRITISAEDRTGSITKSIIWIIVDSQPPWLEVIRPPTYTNESLISISGNVESGASVHVNGETSTVNNGQFTSEVELFPGKNNITISAMDSVDNTRYVFVETTLDLESPTFERIEPLDRSRVDSMVVRVTGVVFDDHGIRAVWGYNATSSPLKISSNGTIDWVVTLNEGDNVFYLEAEDLAGNRRSIELHYTYGNDGSEDNVLPIISISFPLANETVPEGPLRISGNASDDRSVVMVSLRLDGGEWIAVNVTDGSWIHDLDISMGVHLIEASATDGSGNTAFDAVRITSVHREDNDKGDDEGGLDPVFILVLIILIIIAIVVVIYLFLRNKALNEEWNDTQRRMENTESPGSRKERGRIEGRGSIQHARRRNSGNRRNLPRDLPDIENDQTPERNSRRRRS